MTAQPHLTTLIAAVVIAAGVVLIST